METTNYAEAETCARGWLEPLMQELASQHGEAPTATPGTPIQATDTILQTIDVGGALLQLAIEAKNNLYKPLIIVTERVMRRYRIGIGPLHRYYPMRGGYPNFKKAVSNVLSRAAEIAGSTGTIKDKPISCADDLAGLAKTELAPLRIPAEFLLTRQQNGTYILHIGMMQVTLQQLHKICHAMAHG